MNENIDFKIIETMLRRPGEGVFLLGEHLERLESSAARFRFHFDREAVISAITNEIDKHSGAPDSLKIRLLLSASGDVEISLAAIAQPSSQKPSVVLWPEPTDSGDEFLRHKTTRRERYDLAMKQLSKDGFYDAIFANEKGEITEGAWNNVAARVNGDVITPPIECGLLPGVYRRMLLESRQAREGIITPADLRSAETIYLFNSVRGMVEVDLAIYNKA